MWLLLGLFLSRGVMFLVMLFPLTQPALHNVIENIQIVQPGPPRGLFRKVLGRFVYLSSPCRAKPDRAKIPLAPEWRRLVWGLLAPRKWEFPKTGPQYRHNSRALIIRTPIPSASNLQERPSVSSPPNACPKVSASSEGFKMLTFGWRCGRNMSYSQYYRYQGHIQDGHGILHGVYVIGPTEVLT